MASGTAGMRFRNRLINPRRRRSKRWVGYRQPSPLLTQRWPWLENSAWSRTNTLQQPDLSRWVQACCWPVSSTSRLDESWRA